MSARSRANPWWDPERQERLAREAWSRRQWIATMTRAVETMTCLDDLPDRIIPPTVKWGIDPVFVRRGEAAQAGVIREDLVFDRGRIRPPRLGEKARTEDSTFSRTRKAFGWINSWHRKFPPPSWPR